MKPFIHEDFLLQNKTARLLYHEYAENMPIIDYHCHLNPADIAENRQFENLTQAWLYGDHYKWRAMRTNGIDEFFISGAAADEAKFEKWAETVPATLRNPLYHWSHLELKDYFGITELLSPSSAKRIYEATTEMFRDDNFRVLGLLKKMNVEVVCTTDDPVDTLQHHQKLKKTNFDVKVIPAWRPDKVLSVENPQEWNRYLRLLAEISDVDINSYAHLIDALKKRHDYFHSVGCRLSDHGLDTFYSVDYTQQEIEAVFSKLRAGKNILPEESAKFKSAALYDLAVMDQARGWTQQFHIGALRNNNERFYKTLGPDAGFDSIGDPRIAIPMSKFLNRLDKDGLLAKTILYNLNPAHNEVMATMAGNFQDTSVPGKIQWGSAWWFLDQKDGIEKQLNTLSNMGLLSRFVGMLTDSRSFLSYPRHEYFRRILCNLIGKDVENGELPNDEKLLGKMVQDICYFNAKNYFNF